MSSGSESDEEYVPGETEKVSEEESADEETDLQFAKELEYKNKKRKATDEIKGKKIRRTRNGVREIISEPVEEKVTEPEQVLDAEEEKKREEDLWAKFLEGTDPKSKQASKESNVAQPSQSATASTANAVKNKAHITEVKQNNDDEKARERRIFEFAGETIVVENNVIKEKIKSTDNPATVSNLEGTSSRGTGGLSDLLGQLNKKNKLSTLEKTKLDWNTYKKEEDIEDELHSHNKGKSGYLDRKDFLERADLRQYEIERDLRMSRRSKR